MLLAHLRGLLTPGYPNGAASVIREELVLQAISQEVEAAGLFTQVKATAGMMSVVDPASRHRTVRNMMDNLRMGTALMRLEPYEKILRSVKAHSVEANIAAFRVLEKTDIFQALDDVLQRELGKQKHGPAV